MFIKETTIVERNERGRVTNRRTSIEIHETYTDRDYDHDTNWGRGIVTESSFDKILEAYKDYCDIFKWN